MEQAANTHSTGYRAARNFLQAKYKQVSFFLGGGAEGLSTHVRAHFTVCGAPKNSLHAKAGYFSLGEQGVRERGQGICLG